MSLSNIIKNSLLLLILLNITPFLIEGIRTNYHQYWKPHTQVGIMTFSGDITTAYSSTQQLHTLFTNPNIQAILIVMDTTGGNSGACQALHHEILTLKDTYHKPIIALIDNYCTGPSYYIACAADTIIAPGTALIGGIGSCADTLPATCVHNKTDAQLVANDVYQQYTAAVAQQRKLAMTAVATWADGHVFTARQALPLNLIDRIGSLSTAIAVIKEKALIEGALEWVSPTHVDLPTYLTHFVTRTTS